MQRVVPDDVITDEHVQQAAQVAKVYDICVAMVRYTYLQACHKKESDPLQLWRRNHTSMAGKSTMRRHLAEAERESFVTWSDPDQAWRPCRIRHPTRRDTVMELIDAMRAFPIFGIHHPWCPEHEPQTQVFRYAVNQDPIQRIVDYSAGSSCLRCGCYQNVDSHEKVTTFLEKFTPVNQQPREEGVQPFIEAMHQGNAMARSVWQPDVGAVPFNACKDMGWLTKAAEFHA